MTTSMDCTSTAVGKRFVQGLVLMGAVALGSTALAGAEVGTPAPDFTLQGHDGNTYTLSDYTPGNVVFLAHIGYG